MRILANDGIDAAGKQILEAAGHTVFTDKIEQAKLSEEIKNYDVIIVRSATKVTAEIMDAGNLKLIARAGVGLDNIDIKHAGIKNIPVVNTPNASSRSVAELVFAHIFSISRHLQTTNRRMPVEGIEKFNELKKLASAGVELQDKKLGIIGFGRIGKEVARIAIGLGMEVLVSDNFVKDFSVTVSFHRNYATQNFNVKLKGLEKAELLQQADILTVHTSGSAEVIGASDFDMMKNGIFLINCARGGVVNESALDTALTNGKVAYAGIDVFENEPPVNNLLLSNSKISLSPHIGASTAEAQERVGIELAEKICSFF